MTIQNLFIALALLLSPTLFTHTYAQNPSHNNSRSEREEENKGEVDHMIDELNSRNQHVANRCLEDCERSTAAQGSGAEIVIKVIPEYPPIARAAHAMGTVVVKVIVDEEGKVIAAQAVSGHPLLQAAAVKAARQSTFNPYLLSGQAVKVTGTIQYNFSLQ